MEQYRSSANVLLPSLREMVSRTWRCWMLQRRTPWLLLLHLLPPPLFQIMREEEQIVQISKEPCTSELEEAAHSEGRLDLIQGRCPAIPLGSAFSQANQTPAGLARYIPLGVQLDLCSLGSLQITISHGPVVGEVWYEYQSQVITQVLLQLPQFEPSKPSDCPPRIQEL